MKRTVLIITLPFLILTNSCGVKDGEHVIETWEDGKPKIINIWKDGEYKKVKYYPNGEKEESGKYVKREGVYVPDGVWESWYDDGTMKNEVLYENDNFKNSTSYHRNGNKKESGEYVFKDSINWRDGIWESWYDDGTLESESLYQMGKVKKRTEYSYFWNGNKKKEGTYILIGDKLRQDGVWKYWNQDGSKDYQRTFKDGKINGPYISWENNGQVVSGENKNGEKVGIWTVVDSNGDTTSSQDCDSCMCQVIGHMEGQGYEHLRRTIWYIECRD